HQAPGPDSHVRVPAMLAQQIAVERVILVTEEGLLAAVAALRDVMRKAREDRTGEARHMHSVSFDPASANVQAAAAMVKGIRRRRKSDGIECTVTEKGTEKGGRD